jgi:hypothetical protein
MKDDVTEMLVTDEPLTLGSAAEEDGFPNDLPVVPEAFRVTDAETASWVVRKINEARAYRKRVAEWADREMRRSRRDEEFLWFRYGQQLEDWAEPEIARLRGRRRSICLPGGKLGYRKTGTMLVIDDPDEVLRWARVSLPNAVVTKQTLSKTILNQHFEATGDYPVGTHVEDNREKFYIA